METSLTCGRGLAENAVLPAALSAVVGALASVLERHVSALDLTDENAVREQDVYLALVAEQQRVAADLQRIADDMTSSRDLPMARHDMRVMQSDAPRVAFESYVAAESELLAVVGRAVERDQAMLAMMSASHSEGAGG